ncbi:MAG: hypothetical protein ABG776_09950 [Cyanobacteria bacterium J06555_13]
MSKVCWSSRWRSLYAKELDALNQSRSLSFTSNTLKQALSLVCVTGALPLLWQLPAQGDSSAQGQRRIIIESIANYQFIDLASGIEYQGVSQAVRIQRSKPTPLNSHLQSYTEADADPSTAAETVIDPSQAIVAEEPVE